MRKDDKPCLKHTRMHFHSATRQPSLGGAQPGRGPCPRGICRQRPPVSRHTGELSARRKSRVATGSAATNPAVASVAEYQFPFGAGDIA